jgi:hypothetical protein
MAFNLDDYEPVASRISKFYDAHPDGRIITELVHYLADVAVFKAEIYIGDVLVATGWEEEVRNSSHINKTSHLANAETGAVGRGLANYNLAGSDPSKRPSREEMGKVQRMTQSTSAGSDVVTERPANAPSDKQLWLVKKLHKDAGKIPPHNLGSMDKFEVSRLIESLKGGEEIPPPSDYDAPEEPF